MFWHTYYWPGSEEFSKVQLDKCVRCGYCARVCPDFCLKVV